jgi:hypothetical protein
MTRGKGAVSWIDSPVAPTDNPGYLSSIDDTMSGLHDRRLAHSRDRSFTDPVQRPSSGRLREGAQPRIAPRDLKPAIPAAFARL